MMRTVRLWDQTCKRQAVPLLEAEAPFVGTGMEARVARDHGAALCTRVGVIDQVDATVLLFV